MKQPISKQRLAGRTLIASLVILALPGTAQAQLSLSGKCLTQKQLDSLVAVALPDVIVSLSDKCSAFLGQSSYLGQKGVPLARRLAPQAEASIPAARAAMADMVGNPLVASLPPESVRQLLGPLVVANLGPVDQRQCTTLDSGLSALEPLPPANFVRFAAVMVGASGGLPSSRTSIRLCETVAAPTASPAQPISPR